jgi:hypothetical protein
VLFTKDYNLFIRVAEPGNQLADLHLLKSKLLNKPVSKYQGDSGDDKIEKINYSEDEKRIYINKEKYFDNIIPEVWNYKTV